MLLEVRLENPIVTIKFVEKRPSFKDKFSNFISSTNYFLNSNICSLYNFGKTTFQLESEQEKLYRQNEDRLAQREIWYQLAQKQLGLDNWDQRELRKKVIRNGRY